MAYSEVLKEKKEELIFDLGGQASMKNYDEAFVKGIFRTFNVESIVASGFYQKDCDALSNHVPETILIFKNAMEQVLDVVYGTVEDHFSQVFMNETGEVIIEIGRHDLELYANGIEYRPFVYLNGCMYEQWEVNENQKENYQKNYDSVVKIQKIISELQIDKIKDCREFASKQLNLTLIISDDKKGFKLLKDEAVIKECVLDNIYRMREELMQFLYETSIKLIEVKDKIQLDDQVVFYLTPYYAPHGKDYESVIDGCVTGIYENGVMIHYLYGYKSMSDLVAYEHLVARHNEEGEYIRFKGISGRSEILNQELYQKLKED